MMTKGFGQWCFVYIDASVSPKQAQRFKATVSFYRGIFHTNQIRVAAGIGIQVFGCDDFGTGDNLNAVGIDTLSATCQCKGAANHHCSLGGKFDGWAGIGAVAVGSEIP